MRCETLNEVQGDVDEVRVGGSELREGRSEHQDTVTKMENKATGRSGRRWDDVGGIGDGNGNDDEMAVDKTRA